MSIFREAKKLDLQEEIESKSWTVWQKIIKNGILLICFELLVIAFELFKIFKKL